MAEKRDKKQGPKAELGTTKLLQIKVSEPLHELIGDYCTTNRVTLSEFVREAIKKAMREGIEYEVRMLPVSDAEALSVLN